MVHLPKRKSLAAFAEGLNELLLERNELRARSAENMLKARSAADMLQAIFLGIKGGNADYLLDLITKALQQHVDFRKSYKPEDPDYLDDAVMQSPEYRATVDLIQTEYHKLTLDLRKSGTFYSMRSIGHMLWDVNIPGVLGYFAALLYNQNNVAAEASPVTTLMEMEVGNDLCKMLGYTVLVPTQSDPNPTSDKITAWGHITCDGSVANLEGLWMARNLKFYAISVKMAMLTDGNPLTRIKDKLYIRTLSGERKLLSVLDNWTLMNLPIDEVLAIPEVVNKEFKISPTDFGNYINPYTVQSMGYYSMVRYAMRGSENSPLCMGPATKHYSWPKGAAILGIGADCMLPVLVRDDARQDLADLRNKLQYCYDNRIPVMTVVAVIGTTEESAVDDLAGILALREEFRRKENGLEFTVHADAAWGGYFASMLVEEVPGNLSEYKLISEQEQYTLPMSEYVIRQYKLLGRTDSITIDPHKAGYVPYPAGGLCYRNSAMRNLVAFTAPVVYHGGVDPTVGVYGVEGSKPGAAAAAVHFSHMVIRPDKTGYGRIMGHCMFNTKRLYAAFVIWNLAEEIAKNGFFIVPLVPIPAEQEGKSDVEVQQQLRFIRDRIVNVTDEELVNDEEAFALFKELGQDQTIITYMFNFITERGINPDVNKLNELNNGLYTKFSYSPGQTDINKTDIVVTASQFGLDPYGQQFMTKLKRRLRVTGDDNVAIDFNISTVMNPFLTNTTKGSFIPTIIEIFTKQVKEIIREIKEPTRVQETEQA